jgi:hypothetical protein
MATTGDAEFYRPSWIDRGIQWVNELPLNAWMFYVLVGIVLIVIQVIFLWVDDGPFAGELLPIIIFNSLSIPYLLALISFYDNSAVAALNQMKPVLVLKEQEFRVFEVKLSTIPFLGPLLAGLAMMLITILTPLIATPPLRYAALEQLPIFSVAFHIVDKFSAFLFGVILYHTVRQLGLVNAINSKHARVSLYHLRPFQAFSRLTGSTALGLLVFVYLWMLINPELLGDPLLVSYVLVFTLLAVIVFVWPLWGAHRLMRAEKERVLLELDNRFEAIFAKFNRHIQDDEYAAADKFNGTINSLEIEYRRINDIPTWPWSSETARIVLTAIALPLILMIIQFFVLQALDN